MQKLLSQNKAAIADKWLDLLIETYPPDAARLFKRKGDQFGNPVGSTIATGLREIVEGLASGAELSAFAAPLDGIVKIRSIQDFSASQAVAFVLMLKDVLRDELSRELREPAVAKQFVALERRIDELTLLAFDIYAQCRDRVAQIKVDEVKRRVAQLMKESGKFDFGPSDVSDPDSPVERPQQGGVR